MIAGPGGVRAISDRRRRATAAAAASDEAPTEATTATATKPAPTVETVPTERLLTHPPRPRKKKKR